MSEMHDELEEQARAKQNIEGNDTVLNDLAALDQQLSALQSQLINLRGKLTHDRH
jgi:hypothetical protein